MHATPTMTSLSVIGPAKLLVAVMVSADALGFQTQAVENTVDRMEVYFPRPEEQWPVDDEGNRLDLSPVAVANGEVKHARIKFDGTPISCQAALDLIADAENTADEARKALASAPFVGKNGRFYTYTDEVRKGKEVVTVERRHTHGTLRADLEGTLKRLGFKPKEVLKFHGYKPPSRG